MPDDVKPQAIETYRRDHFLRGANAEFADLRQDSIAWNQEKAERALWDQTLMDGLAED